METDYTLKLLIEAQDKFSSTFNSTLSTLKKSVAWLWISLTALWTIKSVVNLADNLEQSQIAFETMLWSWEKATAMLQQLSEFAKKTPFELTWIRDSARQLIAMWVNANDIIPTLKSLWDVSAWLWVSLERLALNYWQVMAQWKLTWRELRDFTMAWVPLLDELSQMLWKTTTQIQDMISKWQISSNDVVQAFQNMTSEWWKFADLMSKQATTLSWLRSNFQDSLNMLWEEIWTQLLPSLKDYTQALWKRLDDNIDNIKLVAQEVIDTAKIVADNVISLIWTIGESLSTFAWFVNDIVWLISDSVAYWMTDTNSITAQWLTWMSWNRHDFFYYVQQWITAIVWSLRTALSVANTLAKSIWKKEFRTWLYEAWSVSAKKIEVWLTDDSRDIAKKRFQEWKRQMTESYNWMKNYIKNETKDVSKTREAETDKLYKDLENNYVNQVEKYTSNTYTATKKTLDTTSMQLKNAITSSLDMSSVDLNWWSSSWWKTKASKQVEELTEEMKSLIKEMEDYWKESEKLRKSTRDWIIDWMEEALKSVEKLADEIVDLQNKINDLNKEQDVDIASAYLKAEQTLKDYKKEYEWIVELSKQFTKSELENESKDREINWFTAKDLLEVKNAYESMQSAFAWLSEEQRQLLDEQIQKQREYNDLNDVEKIKYDYEVRIQAVQQELEEKVKAFQEEEKKYEELKKKELTREQKRLDYTRYSADEQLKINQNLIDSYTRLANARIKAWMWSWIDWQKAWWWDVYAWNSYLVWENWPELFIPSQRWSIIPNNQITNNNWIEINISGVSVRSDNDINMITDEIIRKIKLEKNFWIA